MARPNSFRAFFSSARPTSSSAASAADGAAMVTGRANSDLSSSVRIRGSQIVPRIGAVERLVAEREVGDDVLFDRGFEQRPLEPGCVAHVTARDAAAGDAQPDQEIA